MKQVTPWLVGSICWTLSFAAQAASSSCSKPYSKVLPYDLPLGSERASILLHNELRFEYDCQTLLAQAQADVSAQFLKLDLKVLQAELTSSQTRDVPATGYARLSVAGFEVARQDFDLDSVIDTTISPDTDFDMSKTQVINVGPVAIPILYGIEGNAALEIKAGWKDLGLQAEANPLADATVYVQGSADLQLVQVIARGDLVLLNDKLSNKFRASFEDDGQLFLALEANSDNHLEAFDGGVLVKASVGQGASAKTFERQLFAWDGMKRDDKVANYADRVPVMP